MSKRVGEKEKIETETTETSVIEQSKDASVASRDEIAMVIT